LNDLLINEKSPEILHAMQVDQATHKVRMQSLPDTAVVSRKIATEILGLHPNASGLTDE
jgi:hypothetical protein